MRRLFALACATALAGSLAGPSSAAQAATRFSVTNLVTDDPTANPAPITDAKLLNAWGISYAPDGAFWVSDNHTGKTTVYGIDPGTGVASNTGLYVFIPGDGSVTGQAFNPTLQFNGDYFLFASEDGTISGWRPMIGLHAEVLQAASASNVYKGLALATIDGAAYLYAANFRAGAIDVLKGSPAAPDLAGSFVDPDLPSGYAPFDVANLGDRLYVSYAVQDADKMDDVAGTGNGIVDEFDLQGHLVRRLATGGTLDSPWGLAIAPSSFDTFSGTLLVGNFADGTINGFDLGTGSFVGQLTGVNGQPIAIDGLWGLIPGNGGSGGSTDSLYFAAGPGAEMHGLFGVIAPVPEPTGALLELASVASLALIGRRSG